MKKGLKYLALWQQKRSELEVNDNPQAGWEQLSSLLDEQMPVVSKPGGFKGFKMLPSIFIAFSAAAMVYVASNVYTLEKHKHQTEHSGHKNNPKGQSQAFKDSLTAINAAGNDSLPVIKQGVNAAAGVTPPAANGNAVANAPARTGTSGNAGPGKASPGETSANNGNTKSGTAKTRGNSRLPNAAPGRNAASSSNKNIPSLSVSKNGNSGSAAGHRGGILSNYLHTGRPKDGKMSSAGHSNYPGLRPPGGRRGGGFADKTKPGNHIRSSGRNANPRITPSGFNSRHNMPILAVTKPSLLSADAFANKNGLAPQPLRLNDNIFKKFSAGNPATTKNKKDKAVKPQNTKPSNLDWGILAGVNTSGSFTPKKQNANFYGSSPIDAYFGLFVTYKLNDTWAINPQVRLFSPQTVSTMYTHANQSKVDSGQLLSVTASRKIYAVSVPVYAVYNAGGGISFKAGPVINFPVKQANAASTLLPYSIRSDSTYYKNIAAVLNNTRYLQSINFGISAGASIQFKRWLFEATYLKSLSGYGITSGLGSYKSSPGTFQFTIGFQLDKVKL